MCRPLACRTEKGGPAPYIHSALGTFAHWPSNRSSGLKSSQLPSGSFFIVSSNISGFLSRGLTNALLEWSFSHALEFSKRAFLYTSLVHEACLQPYHPECDSSHLTTGRMNVLQILTFCPSLLCMYVCCVNVRVCVFTCIRPYVNDRYIDRRLCVKPRG